MGDVIVSVSYELNGAFVLFTNHQLSKEPSARRLQARSFMLVSTDGASPFPGVQSNGRRSQGLIFFAEGVSSLFGSAPFLAN